MACSDDVLQKHLKFLQALPAHGNRTLHIDQLFLGLLLAFYDPMVRSMRLIEDCGNFAGHLDLNRLARSTTSDALKVFDPEHLKPLIRDLRARVPELARTDATLGTVTQRIIAADGTYFTVLSEVAWALRHTNRGGRPQGQVRANVQMDVDRWTPEVVTVSGDDGKSEAMSFAPDLLSDVLYVIDRNFLDFSFLGKLLEKRNNFVLRAKSNAPKNRGDLDARAKCCRYEGGVVSDEIVTLSGKGAPAGEFRLVTIHTTNRHGEKEIIRLLTNLMEQAAHVIGAIYRLRWQIELFFKWLKTWARMNHLLARAATGSRSSFTSR